MDFLFAIIFSAAAVACPLDSDFDASPDAVVVQVGGDFSQQMSEDEPAPDQLAQAVLLPSDWDTDKDAIRLPSDAPLRRFRPFWHRTSSPTVQRPALILIPPDLL